MIDELIIMRSNNTRGKIATDWSHNKPHKPGVCSQARTVSRHYLLILIRVVVPHLSSTAGR